MIKKIGFGSFDRISVLISGFRHRHEKNFSFNISALPDWGKIVATVHRFTVQRSALGIRTELMKPERFLHKYAYKMAFEDIRAALNLRTRELLLNLQVSVAITALF